jgi:hypothetical protein
MVRLVDLFDKAKVEGNPTKKAPPSAALWDFTKASKESDDPMLGWKAGDGVTGLKVVDGKLTGTSTTDFPIIYVSGPRPWTLKTSTDSVRVRVQSAPASVGVNTGGASRISKDHNDGHQSPWTIRAPSARRRNSRRSPAGARVVQMSWENFMLRPTRSPGDIRDRIGQAIPQKELQAAIHQGSAGRDWRTQKPWSRSPEISRSTWTCREAWLDRNLGTPEDHPVTFQLAAVSDSASSFFFNAPDRRIMGTGGVDLSAYSGKTTLRFWLDVPEAHGGILGITGDSYSGPAVTGPKARRLEIHAPLGVVLIMCDPAQRSSHDVRINAIRRRLMKVASGALFSGQRRSSHLDEVSRHLHDVAYPARRRRDVPDRLSASAETLAESYRAASLPRFRFPR